MASKKNQPVDWEPFLAGISRGKTVIEYGANRTIFSQGESCGFGVLPPARQSEVRGDLPTRQGSDRGQFWAPVSSSARDAWQVSRCASPRPAR